MPEPTTERIPGVFPLIEIERDSSGYAQKVKVTGTFDVLEIRAMGTTYGTRWLDVKLNGEEHTYS